MLRRITAVSVKEIKQLSRDRMTFGMIVMLPLIQLLLFGFAINTSVRNIPAGLVDLSDNAFSRLLWQTAQATQVVRFTHRYQTVNDAEQALRQGTVRAVLIIPVDLAARYVQKRAFEQMAAGSQYQQENRAVAQWLADGTDLTIAAAVKGLRNMPLPDINFLYADHNRQPSSFNVVQMYNPMQRTVINIVPGLVGIILTTTMIMFTAIAIVKERERGNLEFLIATPIRPFELMLGKIIPYIFIGLLQAFIILSLGHVIFAVPIYGSVLTILLVCTVFIFTSLSLGLLLSTIAKTQMQAMQMTMFVLLPSILLSGFMFPYEAMPTLAQWLAELFPATHFMRMIRAVVLKEAAFSLVLPDIIWCGGFTLLFLGIASLRFRKKLD